MPAYRGRGDGTTWVLRDYLKAALSEKVGGSGVNEPP
jgi:hypothetical protein